jgi:hypothetical protein
MAKKFLTGIDLQNQRAVNAADPSSATDLVTKQYADNLIAAKAWKDPVRVATTANGALATAYANGQTIDGIVLATGDSILLKDQTAGAENGIYVVNAAGAPTRRSDADSTGELRGGTAVYVQAGTANADKVFAITAPDAAVTIGTTSMSWGQVGTGGTSYLGGAGLALSGNTFNVGQGTGIVVNADDIAIDTSVVARKYSTTIGDGTATSFVVTHNLGTKDIQGVLRLIANDEIVEADLFATSATTATVTFATAPAAGAVRVTIIG